MMVWSVFGGEVLLVVVSCFMIEVVNFDMVCFVIVVSNVVLVLKWWKGVLGDMFICLVIFCMESVLIFFFLISLMVVCRRVLMR